jgi:hypothetical protein
MAAVRFAFAENAALDKRDALDLADVLLKERSLAGQSAGQKIRAQAERDPDRGETSKNVELTGDELQVLRDVLDAVPSEQMSEAMRHLHDALLSGW